MGRLIQNWKLNFWRSLCGIVANVLDCDIAVSDFELCSHYYIHLLTNSLRKQWPLPRLLVKSTTTILRQRFPWHLITHKGCYMMKKKPQFRTEHVWFAWKSAFKIVSFIWVQTLTNGTSSNIAHYSNHFLGSPVNLRDRMGTCPSKKK